LFSILAPYKSVAGVGWNKSSLFARRKKRENALSAHYAAC